MRMLLQALIGLAERLPRRTKRWILRLIDIFMLCLSILIAFFLRFDLENSLTMVQRHLDMILLLIVVKFIVFSLSGMYRPILRYAGIEILNIAFRAVLSSTAIVFTLAFLFRFTDYQNFPRSIPILDAVVTLALVIGTRVYLRWFLYHVHNAHYGRKPEKVVIYGAGEAGTELAHAIKTHNYQVVAFVDDNPALQRQSISGISVYAPHKLDKIKQRYDVFSVLLAIPSLERRRKKEIVEHIRSFGLEVKVLPGISELVAGRVEVNQIRKVDIVDLLGRAEVLPKPELLYQNIQGKSVLVTGGGGSIGSELCRQIAHLKPSCLVLYERNELALYNIDGELSEAFPALRLVPCLGSTLDGDRLRQVIKKYKVETIYHAAAYKHVPLVEENPSQGVLNNVQGTLISALVAKECNVDRFVLISTDKAVRPTNVMGTTKRIAELVLQAMAKEPQGQTCFAMVRFGNVLDSAGSVVPRFRKQIEAGGPLTVTHPEITRYFMSIPEAARLVMQAGAMAKGGDVFLLDMGEPVKIVDLAQQMIELSGLQVGRDIEIQFTGLRPGEKLFEELLIDGENITKTEHPKIFSALEKMMPWKELEPKLDDLIKAAVRNDVARMIHLLRDLVPEYQPKLSPTWNDLVVEETEKASEKVINLKDFKHT